MYRSVGVARCAALFTALGVLCFTPAAAASPVELFGFGSHHAGRMGAVAADATDFAATYYNPAGLGFADTKRFTIGVLASASNLQVNGERQSVSEPFGLVLGANAPAPLGGPLKDRLFVGVGLYLLPRTATQVIAHFPDEPFFPYYDNRTQRVVLLPGVAVRITDDLTVGAAANALATLSGSIRASEGATRAVEARIDEKIPTVARLNAGLRYRAPFAPGLSFAAAYRQEFSIPFQTVAETSVAGEPINISIAADGVYTPTQYIAGTSYRRGHNQVGLDLTWSRWSGYGGPFVTVRSELPLVGPLAGELPDVPFKDTIGVRVGGQVLATGAANYRVLLRGGYGFETSPVPANQAGVTNLLDGYKNTVSLGLGIELPHWLGKHTVRIDVHAAAQLVGTRTMSKQIIDGGADYDPYAGLRDEVTDDPAAPETQGAQISNPGYPNIRSEGQMFSGGFTVEISL